MGNEGGIRGPHDVGRLGAWLLRRPSRCSPGAPTVDTGGGDPGAMPLAAGQSCGSIRGELDKLDAQGHAVQGRGGEPGKKLAPAAQADVDRYNSLLNQYLGARCHV